MTSSTTNPNPRYTKGFAVALPSVSVPETLRVREGSTLLIPLTKTGTGVCSVELRTSGISAKTDLDYIGFDAAPTIVFQDRQTEAYGSLAVLADQSFEADESLTVWVNNPVGCTVAQGKCIVTIENTTERDTRPVVSIPATLTVREGDALTVPVTKDGAGACSVKLRTTGDTARTLTDYAGYDPYPTVSFAESETSASAILQTLSDAAVEGPETTVITLVEPDGCVVGSGRCVVTIEDATDPATVPPDIPPVDPPDENPPDNPEAPVTRFPRTVGFATGMAAGTGKPIYRVTTLKDGGSGSLREAVSRGDRLVVFEVAGCIRLASTLFIDHDNVTIAGQTAPPPGITVQGKELQVRASNIRVEHVTFERGHDPKNTGNADVIKISPGSRSSSFRRSGVHFNHCAFFWGIDETVEIWPSGGSLSTISFTDCIFSEPLWRPQKLGYKAHDKVASGKQGEHNYGLLIGYGTKKVDIQNCLFQDMYFRTPFIDHGTTSVIANNILQNIRIGACIHMNVTPPPKDACLVNAQGILCISGPQSGNHTGFRFHFYPAKWPSGSAVYASNLYGWRGVNAKVTPGTSVTFSKAPPTQGKSNTPVVVHTPPLQPPGTTVRALSADDLFERLVANVGPMPKAPLRNPSVVRSVNKLRTKTAGWVDHQSQVGGFSYCAVVSRSLDDVKTAGGDPLPVPDATDRAAVKRWLDAHTKLVSHD